MHPYCMLRNIHINWNLCDEMSLPSQNKSLKYGMKAITQHVYSVVIESCSMFPKSPISQPNKTAKNCTESEFNK